jgi:carbamoylphosphate synthase large subunit
MTNKEALIAVCMVVVPDLSVEKALIDNDIIGEDEYSVDVKEEIDLCAIDVLKGTLALADITEGGYSVRYDRKAIQARLDQLMAALDIAVSTEPTIDGASPW